MMQNATRDLLRLVLTAGAVAGILLYANFEASRAGAGAMARTDSFRYVRTISEQGMTIRPDFVRPEPTDPEVATPADSMARHSAKPRYLLALAR